MLLSELPVELRSKIYFHSDSAALLGVWRLRALRPLRLPPRARAAALRGFCARLAEQLSDEALADLQTSLDLASVQRDIEELREAEAALKRLRDGSYGSCITCSQPIALARLKAFLA